jgi:outer membrane scaffolding protein for murein synthesis (MipA/OmpV family)
MSKYLVFFLMLISPIAVISKPLWELGAGIGGQYVADYRGSENYQTQLLPVPYFIYRGEKFRIDRGGVRSDLLNTSWWEINVSGEASLAGVGDDNALREGMPDIDPTFELGPSLNIALDGNIKDDGWLLRFPVRGVVALNTSGPEYVGYVFNPKLTYTDQKESGWRISTSFGALWGSEAYHDYFYEVAPQFVLADRPAYDAQSGFSGYYFKSSFGQLRGKWRWAISLRYDNLKSTDFFESSPLVETDDFFSVSFIVIKVLKQSKRSAR